MKDRTKIGIIVSQLVLLPVTIFAVSGNLGLKVAFQPIMAESGYQYSGGVDFVSANATRSGSTVDTTATSLAGNHMRLHGVNMGDYGATHVLAFKSTDSYADFVDQNGDPFNFSGSRVRRVTLYKAVYSTGSFRLQYKLNGDTEYRDHNDIREHQNENTEYTIYLSGDSGMEGIVALRIRCVSGNNGCFSRVTIGYFCNQ